MLFLSIHQTQDPSLRIQKLQIFRPIKRQGPCVRENNNDSGQKLPPAKKRHSSHHVTENENHPFDKFVRNRLGADFQFEATIL